jgi:hypothetical protein
MSPVQFASLILALLFSLASTGCFWKKKPPAPPATPPPQAKAAAPIVTPAPPPPKIETKVPEATPGVAVKLPETPKPPQTKQPPRRTRRMNTPAAAKTQVPPATAVETAPDAAVPPPKLGDLLNDAERADLVRKCDQAIQRARTALTQLSSKTLSAEASESAERVRVFIQQAEQARTRDPQTALQLAQRAEVLARDLLKSAR